MRFMGRLFDRRVVPVLYTARNDAIIPAMRLFVSKTLLFRNADDLASNAAVVGPAVALLPGCNIGSGARTQWGQRPRVCCRWLDTVRLPTLTPHKLDVPVAAVRRQWRPRGRGIVRRTTVYVVRGRLRVPAQIVSRRNTRYDLRRGWLPASVQQQHRSPPAGLFKLPDMGGCT